MLQVWWKGVDSHTATFWAPCPQHRTAVALAGLSWEAAGEFCITALILSQVSLQRAFLWSFPSKLVSFSDYPSLLLQLKTNFSKRKILRWCRRNKGFTEGFATDTFTERVAQNVFLPYNLSKEHTADISGSRISTTLSSAT